MQFKRLTIRNVQSVKEVELNFDPKACHHLMGDNNIGKSTIMKAINILVNNVSSRQVRHYLRDYADHFYIESEDFEGNTVAICRGDEDYYKWNIDGVEGFLPDAKKEVPKQVKEYFNFYTDEKTKENLNIRLADDRLPFVHTTAGENYYILQKALRIEEYLKAIKLGGEKKREHKKSINVKEERLEEVQDSLENVPDYRPLVKDIEVYENAADEMVGRIKLAEECKGLYQEVERKEEEIQVKSFDYDEDKVNNLVEQVMLIRDVVEKEKELTRKKEKLSALREITDVFVDVPDMIDRLTGMYESKKLLEEKTRLEKAVEEGKRVLEAGNKVIEYWEESESGDIVSEMQIGEYIVRKGKELRERKELLGDRKGKFDEIEKERKDFMLVNKLCPVVLEMEDNRCPFSGDTIDELMDKGGV